MRALASPTPFAPATTSPPPCGAMAQQSERNDWLEAPPLSEPTQKATRVVAV
jgi:hypothetical protein